MGCHLWGRTESDTTEAIWQQQQQQKFSLPSLIDKFLILWGFPVEKNPPANAKDQETQVRPLGREDPLEEEVAPHSSILAWEIPWTEEPGRLQSMGLQRVGHD